MPTKEPLTRISMITKKPGYQAISFNSGIYQGWIYIVQQGGAGIRYKKSELF